MSDKYETKSLLVIVYSIDLRLYLGKDELEKAKNSSIKNGNDGKEFVELGQISSHPAFFGDGDDSIASGSGTGKKVVSFHDDNKSTSEDDSEVRLF